MRSAQPQSLKSHIFPPFSDGCQHSESHQSRFSQNSPISHPFSLVLRIEPKIEPVTAFAALPANVKFDGCRPVPLVSGRKHARIQGDARNLEISEVQCLDGVHTFHTASHTCPFPPRPFQQAGGGCAPALRKQLKSPTGAGNHLSASSPSCLNFTQSSSPNSVRSENTNFCSAPTASLSADFSPKFAMPHAVAHVAAEIFVYFSQISGTSGKICTLPHFLMVAKSLKPCTASKGDVTCLGQNRCRTHALKVHILDRNFATADPNRLKFSENDRLLLPFDLMCHSTPNSKVRFLTF